MWHFLLINKSKNAVSRRPATKLCLSHSCVVLPLVITVFFHTLYLPSQVFVCVHDSVADFIPYELHLPTPLLDNIQVMMIVWRLRGNIIRTALCWIVWHNVYSQQHTYNEQFLQVKQIGFVTLGPFLLCVEAVAYSCIIVSWWSGSGGIQAWSRRPTGFLQCFDTWFGHLAC